MGGVVCRVVGMVVARMAPGSLVSVLWPMGRVSGPDGQGAELGQDLSQKLLSWGQAQHRLPGVADQAGGHDQQPVAQGAQVGSAAAVAVVQAGELSMPTYRLRLHTRNTRTGAAQPRPIGLQESQALGRTLHRRRRLARCSIAAPTCS